MKSIRRALTGQLSPLVGGRVYDDVAPQTATYPLIVLHLMDGTDEYTFGGRSHEPHVWLVKAIDKSGSADTADDLAAAIDDALTDQTLLIPGRTQLYLRRRTTVRFTEVDGDITYRHSGATFRLITEEA